MVLVSVGLKLPSPSNLSQASLVARGFVAGVLSETVEAGVTEELDT